MTKAIRRTVFKRGSEGALIPARSPLGVIRIDLACPSRSGYGLITEVPVVQFLPVEGRSSDVIQATKREPQIMRYELTDFEWDAITSFLPNKPRGGPNVAYGTAAE